MLKHMSIEPVHALKALRALTIRELIKFWQQRGRLFSAMVRPALWLLVFAAGFQNVFGMSIIPPYQTYIEYQVYIAPGLLAMVLLFSGMQTSLAMVYDREMGVMRLLLTAPLPRWYLLLCKLLAGTFLSVLQAYAFLLVCTLFGIDLPGAGWWRILPALVLGAAMLGALGLLLSVTIRQLENFASTMNFVIFPMFFLSTALYPLWKLEESGADIIHWIARFNPFTHVIEFIRFSMYGEFNGSSLLVVMVCFALFFFAAVQGYKPQGVLIRRKRG